MMKNFETKRGYSVSLHGDLAGYRNVRWLGYL